MADRQSGPTPARDERHTEEIRARAHRTAESRAASVVYWSTRAAIRLLLFPYFRIRSEGREHLAIDGPVIIAPTHRSNLDSFLLAPLSPRRYRALAKESLFSVGPLRWFISCLGGFPVRRGTADRESMRVARSLLDRGEMMIVFPEGTRQSGPLVAELFDGTAYLAAKTQARVVPVGVAGTEAALPAGARFPRPARVRIVIGEPIDPPESTARRSELRLFTDRLGRELQEAMDAALART